MALTHTATDNLELPNYLEYKFLDLGKKLKNLGRTLEDTGGTCKLWL